MSPSEYISRFGRYRDYLALQQILDDYKWSKVDLVLQIVNRTAKYHEQEEYINEITFADDKIKEWKQLENVAI